MSESTSAAQIVVYLVGMLPSMYFLFMLLRAVYFSLTKNDEDIL
ncbi:MAG: hypothetical protein NWE89_09660 [Candidatus Bathyarchaeota archaeon]|nr:hypothetical protein [Candidatus Bathyarchaeota archaeon]